MPSGDALQTVERAFDLIEAVGEEETGLSLGEIAERLGLKPPTARGLAKTLLRRGLLEKSGRRGRYRLGAKVFALAQKAWSTRRLKRAEAEVRRLAELFPEGNVVYAEEEEGEIAVRLRMTPERPGVMQRPSGRRVHPYATATALVFHAFWNEEERRAFRRKYPFIENGAHLWKHSEFEKTLEEVREKGRALVRFPDGLIFAAAAPVFGPGGEFVGSIGVSIAYDVYGLEAGVRRAVSAQVKKSAGLLSDWRRELRM